jgi:hypothetical protein
MNRLLNHPSRHFQDYTEGNYILNKTNANAG